MSERIGSTLTPAQILKTIKAPQEGLAPSNLNIRNLAPDIISFCQRASTAERFIAGDRNQLVNTQAFIDHREAMAALDAVSVSYKDLDRTLESTQTVMRALIEGTEASPEDVERAQRLIEGFDRRARVGAYSFTKEE